MINSAIYTIPLSGQFLNGNNEWTNLDIAIMTPEVKAKITEIVVYEVSKQLLKAFSEGEIEVNKKLKDKLADFLTKEL
jgi:hypothetical protein